MDEKGSEPAATAPTASVPVAPSPAAAAAQDNNTAPQARAPGAVLTKEQADKLVRRNISNLVKKVAEGRTLTQSELALVQAAAEGSDPTTAKAWASDQVELAEALGVTRKTIQRWREDGAPSPESDGRWSVTAWKAWMQANGKHGKEDNTPSRQQLEAKRLLLMNDKLETEIGILKGEYTRNSDILLQIRAMIVEARKVGEQMPASLAPQLAGLTVPEIEKRLRAWWDDYCMTMHTGAPACARGAK
jgi:hypothetical protein